MAENNDPGIAGQDVSLHAARGTAWTYLGFVSSRLLAFASSVLLVRLLIPEQFGLMSYCLMAIQFIEIFNTFGMDAALIARRDRFAVAANTTFFVALAISLLTYAAAWFIAPLVAAFFDAPEVTGLLRVLALVLPIGSLDLVHHSMVQRQLRFKQTVIPEITATLVKAAVAIFLAWKGYGAWSLVIGHVAGEVVTTLAYWMTAPWLPRLQFDAQVTRDITRYGLNMVGVGLAGALLVNLDYIFVGRLLGTAALGFYTLGYRVPELVIRNFNFVVGRVGLPVLARVQQEHELLRTTYLKYLRFVSLFVFPAGIGIAMTAHLFVPVFYTEKWLPTVGVMQILAVAMTVTPLGFLPGVLYKAVNRPEILMRMVAIKVPVSAVLLWFGARWGINGVAMGQLVSIVFAVMLDSLMVRHVFGVRGQQMLQAIAPALGATTCMALVLGAVILLTAPSGLMGLLVLSALGMLTYVGSLMVLSRETVWRTRDMLRQMIGKNSQTEVGMNQRVEPTVAPPAAAARRISVVIPSYNGAAYLGEALDSVLQQTYPVDEILVVDDGSTDDTAEVAGRYQAQGVRYLRQENQGVSFARNRGMQETSGDWIAFLDSDDVWEPDKIARQVDYLERHPQTTLVSGDLWFWHVEADTRRIMRVGPGGRDPQREIAVRNFVGNTSLVLVRRDIMQALGGFDTTLRFGEDWEMWIRVLAQGEAGFVPHPLILYRWHAGSNSHFKDWKRFDVLSGISRAAIVKTRPAWQRGILHARRLAFAQANRAAYAISTGMPPRVQVKHAVAALCLFPFEESKGRGGALRRALRNLLFGNKAGSVG